MSRRFLLILGLVNAVIPIALRGQAQNASRVSEDTLPADVAKASLEAYNRHDVAALTTYYANPNTHEMLGDSAARFTGTPEQMSSSLVPYFAKNQVHAELRQTIVSGPFVVLFYDFIENGKRTPHLDIYEVRHGKIVHEWDQGP